MPTFEDRPNAALLVVDVQTGVVADAWNRDAVIANINTLVDRARASSIPVIWVLHVNGSLPRGSDAWQLAPELKPKDTEPLVHKIYGDSFEDTDLSDILEKLRVGHLFVTGSQTDACVRLTVHGAFTRGYDVTLVGDAHTTDDNSQWGMPKPELVVKHFNMCWDETRAPGRKAAVVDTADVKFA